MKEIEHGISIVFKNYIHMTLVMFEFVPNKNMNIINVFNDHKKVFTTMKHVTITRNNHIFEHLKGFPDNIAY